MKPILSIAQRLGIPRKYVEFYGEYKAKISLNIFDYLAKKPNAKYIDVTAITPTPLGEGKTVTTIGLSMAMNRLGAKAIACIRQPSLGPMFGVKGGATGGGKAKVVPSEDINLHFTGDAHAVGLAHNLCAAFLDNALFHGQIVTDPHHMYWRRVTDVSDRALRHITAYLKTKNGRLSQATGFDITGVSEVMAILALAGDLPDLRKRIGRIVVAISKDNKPITADDLGVAGAMTVLLKDAIKPNLVQTTEETPVFIHAGPFAHIAHGNSSIIADKIALKVSDYVVTESGFGADCGAEKFFDIKCRYSGLKPDAVVLVCTARALKMHSGKFHVAPGKPLDKNLYKENCGLLQEGSVNLAKQIENIKLFGVPCVVAINQFPSDTKRELELIRILALSYGADDVAVSSLWSQGSRGGTELARAVMKAAKTKNSFRHLYPLAALIAEKIETIAKNIYGAKKVSYSRTAQEKIKLYTKLRYNRLPVCMAKTQFSLSHNPKLKGRPENFVLPIHDVRPCIGAGFLYAICGLIATLPGLPAIPSGTKVDIDKNGVIRGLN